MPISRARRMANVVRSIVEQADPAGELTPSGSGTDAYTTIAELPLSGNESGAKAFVSENNRLYIWTGTGWYNIALINTSPTAITGANPTYELATDGTPIELTLTSTDPEGLPITWSYAVTSGSLENGGGATATISQAANIFTITPTTTEDYAGEFSLTFTASDGVNLATATSSFTLMFAILNSKYTSLMLKTSSTNAQQNNTFVDSSTNNFTITRNGNTTQGTFSPYGNKWSNYFDGSGDVLSLPTNQTALNLGNSDFTVEAWVFRLTSSGNTILLCGQSDLNSAAGSSYGFYITGTATSELYIGGSGYGVTNPNPPIGQWAHIAYVRTGGTFSSYLNGTRVGTVSVPGSAVNVGSTGYSPSIGAFATAGAAFNGYICDLRLVKGTVYDATQTTITVPTDPLTAIAGTSLLTCQSNSFKDNSTNNFAITRNGDVKVEHFSPYDQDPYNPAVNGGSAYFDGASWLTTPASSLTNIGTGDFTVEFWFYMTQTATYGTIFNLGQYNTGIFIRINTQTYDIWIAGSQIYSTGTAPRNSWVHLALVRSAGNLYLWANGVQVGSTVANSTSISPTASMMIGASAHATSTERFFGYVSNLRVVTGTGLYTAPFTPPTAPLTAVTNTQLLCNFTNAGIYDSSGNNNLDTTNDAKVSTAVVKYGSGSMYFDGGSDRILIPITSKLYPETTSNFTVECWVYLNILKDSFFVGQNDGTTQSWSLRMSLASGAFFFGYNGTGTTTAITVSPGQWYHLAMVYNSAAARIYGFVDGVKVLDSALASITPNTTIPLSIGSRSTGIWTLDGYISDLRITKGLARYTENFTPPTSELLG